MQPSVNNSAPESAVPLAGRKLDSWKEIADFLSVSVRTAHRWKDTGMPVHYTPAGHVWADSSELERWRRPRTGQRRRRWAIGGGLLAGLVTAAVVSALILSTTRPAPPASVSIEGQQVTAQDEAGRVVWTTTISQRLAVGGWGWDVSVPEMHLVADVDGDGAVEVLLSLPPADAAEGPGRLVCYEADGRVRWELVLGRAFADQFGRYAVDYIGHILRVVRIGGRPLLLSLATHRLWNPSQVALVDPRTGQVVEEFWHPGAITHALVADLDGDGADELVMAGLNNPGPGPGSPVLMTLGLPFSRHLASPDSLMADMSDGGPAAYVVFPRPDVLEAQGGMAAITHLRFEAPETLLARVRVTADQSTSLTYRLDPELRVRDLFAAIDVASVHDVLWKTGPLTHRFSTDELEWLETLRRFTVVPDGNAVRIPPFAPARR